MREDVNPKTDLCHNFRYFLKILNRRFIWTISEREIGRKRGLGEGKNFGGGEFFLAEGLDGEGGMPFGEAFSRFIDHEWVMKVFRFGKIEEGLEEAVDVSGGEEVFATGDVGDLLGGVVDHHREVVGCAEVFAGEDDITEEGGVDLKGAEAGVMESERADEVLGFLGIETPCGVGVFWRRG